MKQMLKMQKKFLYGYLFSTDKSLIHEALNIQTEQLRNFTFFPSEIVIPALNSSVLP